MSVYIKLFHGRKTLDEDLKDWGSTGPIIGPFESVIFTYMSTIRASLPNGDCFELPILGDCVEYDNILYGDFSIVSDQFFIDLPDQRDRLITHNLKPF